MEKITGKFADYLLLCVVFIVGAVFGISIFIATAPREEVGTAQSEVTNSNEEIDESVDLSRDVSVYLAWWDQDNGFESLKENAALITTINPFWYEMEEDGTIRPFSGAGDSQIISYCKKNGIRIVPVISNEHERYPVDTVLSDSSLTEFHINQIVTLVLENGYDGIEIDYESLDAEDRKSFSDFMTDLSTELVAEGKTLSTAVHAKTSDQGTWGGPAAQDWSVLNTACDTIKIMTYDYHWSTSEAGDIAPISWMREVLDYAITTMDPEKIRLGIHLYGYDWVESTGTDLTYSDVEELIDRFDITNVRTSDELEKYFLYESGGEQHTVYFSNRVVVSHRLELATDFDLGGVGLWRIGQEDSEIWGEIESAFGE